MRSTWSQHRFDVFFQMLGIDDFERDFVTVNLYDRHEMVANTHHIADVQFKFHWLHAQPP